MEHKVEGVDTYGLEQWQLDRLERIAAVKLGARRAMRSGNPAVRAEAAILLDSIPGQVAAVLQGEK
jgi:hypothetical protein